MDYITLSVSNVLNIYKREKNIRNTFHKNVVLCNSSLCIFSYAFNQIQMHSLWTDKTGPGLFFRCSMKRTDADAYCDAGI